MRLLLLLVISLALALAPASCDESPPPLLMLGGLQPEIAAADATGAQYVATTIDQFGASANGPTFQQLYFVNTTYSAGKGYHILFLEGEYAASATRVSNEAYPHMQIAKDNGATVWSLEHRFYGSSKPFSNLSVGNLTYLSSQQAVEDVAQFIRTQNAISGESSPKWVLFGGSYSGNIALWTRQKYPDLTAGVVASSAPALVTVDNTLFQKNVDDSYRAYDVNCYNAIASAALTVRQLTQYSDGRDQLSSALKLFTSLNALNLTYNDLQFFEFMLANVFRVPVVYNRVNVAPFATGCGVAEVCAIMTNTSQTDDLQRVAGVVSYVQTQLMGGFYGLFNDYSLAVQRLSNVNITVWSGLRAWNWQLCNELGSPMTTDYGRGLFGSSIPNNLLLDACVDLFGASFTVDNLKAGLKATRAAFNISNVFTGTNAVIVTGGADPWRSLGVNQTTDGSAIAYTADGMAHCGDLRPAGANDSYGTTNARSIAAKQVKAWLSGSSSAKAAESLVAPPPPPQSPATSESRWREMKPSTGSILFNIANPSLGRRRRHEKRSPYKFGTMNKLSFHKQLRKRVEQREGARRARGEKPVRAEMEPYYMFGSIWQDLDHFDPNNHDRFQQYFVYNNEYRNEYTNVHFLMISGESYLDWFMVSPYLQMLSWARHWNATVYGLEHRFYGDSQPKKSVATRYLKWLTVEQALADTAVFISATNNAYNYTNAKWVAFGGSYAGNLAAWFRLKYPSLTVGAVASSAPVQVKTDFFEYLQVVENSTRVFGGATCAKNVATFFSWAQRMLTTKKGRMRLSKDFYMCDAWCEYSINEKDAELLMAYMIFDLSTYVQYDDEGHDYVRYICDAFADEDGDVGAGGTANNLASDDTAPPFDLVKIAKLLGLYKNQTGAGRNPDWSPDSSQSSGSSGVASNGCTASEEDSVDTWWCNDITYESMVEYYQITNTYWYDTSDRCWTWQACTEWGYFQSSNYGYGLFNSALPVNFAVDLCSDVFGEEYNRTATDGGVRNSNWLYGGSDNYNGTNVVFVNGSEDPWHVLSVYNTPNPNANVTSILITGTSHCEDMYHQEQYDKPGLKAARKQIKKVLKTWLD